ncbi:hypothetical protein NLU13_6597 [Sarocladium strictum]|uniref:Alpha/beta hydrolase fold-3 domain-containing protein n=1 Tax=Sarocladium strictum TaxID=5046 RepID=A0AA39L6V5_SARSR|nr:hypothetical protein NLU13_6597 [Sarocladium strictum]
MAPSIDNPESWLEYAEPDAELQQLLDDGVKPRFSGPNGIAGIPQHREEFDAIFLQDAAAAREAAGDSVREEEIFIPTRDGSEIRALVYYPSQAQDDGRPLVIMIHGGGFIVGTAEMETPPCIAVARSYDCVCVSLEYRLSPEVKFPVAYEDCWDAIVWLSRNAALRWGADLEKGFILGGLSAGGHISIPLSHRARDEGLNPPLTGLYLGVTPSLMPRALTEEYKALYRSREQLAHGMTLTAESTKLYDEAVEPDMASPYWNPLLWPTGHANLPPTFFQICGADLLRDEALIYERTLRVDHGTKTKAIVYPGLPHVFWYNFPGHSASSKYVEDTRRGYGWLLGREDF